MRLFEVVLTGDVPIGSRLSQHELDNYVESYLHDCKFLGFGDLFQ